MAVTIVGEDHTRKQRTTCPNCAAILEYTRADTTLKSVRDYGGGSDTYRQLDCPRCHTSITIALC